ncbi:phytanoyl-CoA dioxygenase family protein [Veronia nyctiphanis]|uniref:Phytanoyl-CoA dioxygenase family protein n=1 Tax=Veronia nyctiphanis TaxID=1278244 RepID=A0A4Q0YEY5_9GAMM|nr:phytanoyl-CoA dioxygenase family protein [Veronia nyctiphanis]RXJ69052.1 phytanoyl-CoA dioxygenase family protein [Veronia nyctiphanis]
MNNKVKPLTDEQIAAFHRDGFLIIEKLLSEEEVALVKEACLKDEVLMQSAMEMKDSQGRKTDLSLWNHPGDDIYGMIARSERVVDTMEKLLDDEVYHYHSKLSAKKPRVGGAWEWHQDYGYWYQNGCLFPDMASIFIAVDRCTKENGCLQVLKGSHKMGRIEHSFTGEQTGADPERMAWCMEKFERVYCEMPAGSAVIFHSNTLHGSEGNLSDESRWGLISVYNTKHNDPLREHHHPGYTPLEKVPDSAIVTIGAKPSEKTQKYLNQEEDDTSTTVDV